MGESYAGLKVCVQASGFIICPSMYMNCLVQIVMWSYSFSKSMQTVLALKLAILTPRFSSV